MKCIICGKEAYCYLKLLITPGEICEYCWKNMVDEDTKIDYSKMIKRVRTKAELILNRVQEEFNELEKGRT